MKEAMKERRSYAEGERVSIQTMKGYKIVGLLLFVSDGIFGVREDDGSEVQIEDHHIASVQIEKREEPWQGEE